MSHLEEWVGRPKLVRPVLDLGLFCQIVSVVDWNIHLGRSEESGKIGGIRGDHDQGEEPPHASHHSGWDGPKCMWIISVFIFVEIFGNEKLRYVHPFAWILLWTFWESIADDEGNGSFQLVSSKVKRKICCGAKMNYKNTHASKSKKSANARHRQTANTKSQMNSHI